MVARGGVWIPAAYPPELKQRAVELARRRDKPIAQIAKELGVVPNSECILSDASILTLIEGTIVDLICSLLR